MHNGWYQVAYARDIVDPIHEVVVDDARIALIPQDGGEILAISAYCPHRGANLCKGGVVDGNSVICPFHGLAIGLDGKGKFAAIHYDVLVVSGLVFIRKQTAEADTFSQTLNALDKDHYIVPGFELVIAAKAEMVIENAFDQSHFRPVHKVHNSPKFTQADSALGTYAVSGTFELPASRWQTGIKAGETAKMPFLATAYSPTIVLSLLSGDRPYYMLTTTQPISAQDCIVRLSLAIRGTDGAPPTQEECQYLLTQAQAGIEQDAKIWAFMSPIDIFNPLPDDEFVSGFRAFCAGYAV